MIIHLTTCKGAASIYIPHNKIEYIEKDTNGGVSVGTAHHAWYVDQSAEEALIMLERAISEEDNERYD